MVIILRDCALVAVMLLLPSVLSYPTFRDRIPHGYNVVSPFNRSELWDGVGHWRQLGGGARNPFGLALANNDFVWNQTLCNMDSDLDGRSNGVELCDPNCSWKRGQDPPAGSCQPTHPGLCEPHNDPACKEPNKLAEPTTYTKCEVYEEIDVQTLEIRPPMQELRYDEDTTYYCQFHRLPSDRDYHVVGYQPLVTTPYIHHIEMYACTDQEVTAELLDRYGGHGGHCHELAGMLCSHAIALWTYGYSGDCLEKPLGIGYKIGREYKWAIVEHHWNNPDKKSGLFDNAGLRLYYTPNLRPYNVGTYQVVESFLNIPPNTDVHTELAVCGSACTTRPFFPASCINLLSVNIHMHLLGHSANVRLTNSSGTYTIATDLSYNYAAPSLHNFREPIRWCRGDTLTVDCKFTTRNSNNPNYIHYGESTQEEMCVGYFSYYPWIPGVNYCTEAGEVSYCETAGEVISGTTNRGCNIDNFVTNSPVLFNIVNQVHSAPQCAGDGCSQACLNHLKCTHYKKHNCLKHKDIRFVLSQYLMAADGFTEASRYQNLGRKMDACHRRDPADSHVCVGSRSPPRRPWWWWRK